MHRIKLTSEQEKELVGVFKTTEDKHLRDRVQAVLMASRQRQRKQIAEDLAVDGGTLRRWLKAWREEGLEGLKIEWSEGRTPLISEAHAAQLIEWAKQGPTSCGLDRANWTFAELADHFYKVHGLQVSETTMREFCHKHHIYPYRPTYRFLRGNPEKQESAKEELAELKKKALEEELVLLSQDEARFPMVPTLRTTIGVKGHRPLVGTNDCKDAVYLFGAINLVTGELTTRTVEVPAKLKKKTGSNKTRLLQTMFGKHLEDIGRKYPNSIYKRVVITIDNAPWHKGKAINAALAKYPNLELYRLPSYSPQLNVIERFWRILRRRATHNRLFDSMTVLRSSLRNSLCYYQTLKHKILSLIESRRKRAKAAAL